ncbi:MAG: segregation/condensation protein A [Oscillospiraceae bacterium]|nr:segregation/condensation protein A [Candidatus Limimonas egerieequi]
MEKINYKLEVFEGPMDLLLSLITKHKLDIMDIPIVTLVDQYTEYVRLMQDADMEVASEFLEMAARLVYIKTVSLLPKHEEADELKAELTGELLEYRDCQIMAGKLKDEANGFDYLSRKPDVIDRDNTYKLLHEPDELFSAYIAALGKGKRKLPPPVTSFTEIVSKKIVSVSSKIIFILRRALRGGDMNFKSLIEASESRSDMVATFLAVLELVKAKRMTAEGNGDEMKLVLKNQKD